MPFDAEHLHRSDAHVVSLAGELDLAAADDAMAFLSEAATDGCPRLIVDLSALSFLDSTGLRVLLRAERAARASSVEFQIANPRPPVSSVFSTTGTDTHFEFVDLDDE